MHRENKRGQDLSIGTLVLIVLGIVVLVLLILGFSLGWQDLFTKINIFSGGSNLESVAQACNLAATSNAAVSYCNDFKKVKINGVTHYVNCDYADLASSIQTKLSCPSTENEIEKRCIALIKNEYRSQPRPLNVLDITSKCTKNFESIYVNDKACNDFCSRAIAVL